MYVSELETTPNQWPGYSARAKGTDDSRSRGMYTLQIEYLRDNRWHVLGWQRLTMMEAAHAVLGTWRPETTPAREVPRRDARSTP